LFFVFWDRSEFAFKTPHFRSTTNTGTPKKGLNSSCCFPCSSVNNPASSAVFAKASLLLSLPSVPNTNCVHYPCNLCLLLRNFHKFEWIKAICCTRRSFPQWSSTDRRPDLTNSLVWNTHMIGPKLYGKQNLYLTEPSMIL
ncbi:hypothetical protein ILYODFUR_010422, partial [Ilyodon furcidens]